MIVNPTQIHIEAWPPNRSSKGVRVTHTPTGLRAVSMTKRSVHENKYSALKDLHQQVNEYHEDSRDE